MNTGMYPDEVTQDLAFDSNTGMYPDEVTQDLAFDSMNTGMPRQGDARLAFDSVNTGGRQQGGGSSTGQPRPRKLIPKYPPLNWNPKDTDIRRRIREERKVGIID
jgi:hypothetical protein